jgi:hypothetical protein
MNFVIQFSALPESELFEMFFVFVAFIAGFLIWKFWSLLHQCPLKNFTTNSVPCLKNSLNIAFMDQGLENKIEKINLRYSISEQLFLFIQKCATTFKRSYQHCVFGISMYNIIKAKDVEKVLQSTKHLDKSKIYECLYPFLRTGLLTSTSKKHFMRRRMLTPTFHFEILKEFVEIFENESDKLVESLKQTVGIQLDLIPIASQFALNLICGKFEGLNVHKRFSHLNFRVNDGCETRPTRNWTFFISTKASKYWKIHSQSVDKTLALSQLYVFTFRK